MCSMVYVLKCINFVKTEELLGRVIPGKFTAVILLSMKVNVQRSTDSANCRIYI